MSDVAAVRERLIRLWRDGCLPWYAERSEQEQRLLLLAAIILPLTIMVFGILLPIHDRIAELQKSLPAKAQQAAEAEQLAVSLKEGKTARLQGSLLSNIERMSNQAAVRSFMTHIRPEATGNGQERLMLQFKDVPYDKYIAFTYRLAEKGINILFVRIQAASAAGKVHVQMKVSR